MQNLGAKTYLKNKDIENEFHESTHHVVLICWIQYKNNWFPYIYTAIFMWLKVQFLYLLYKQQERECSLLLLPWVFLVCGECLEFPPPLTSAKSG